MVPYLQVVLKWALPTILWTYHQDLCLDTLQSRFQISRDVYWNKALVWSLETSVTVSIWRLVAL